MALAGNAGACKFEEGLKVPTEMESTKTHAEAEPFRCHCGSLLARLVPEGVELKCRRCKRRMIVPLKETAASDSDGQKS